MNPKAYQNQVSQNVWSYLLINLIVYWYFLFLESIRLYILGNAESYRDSKRANTRQINQSAKSGSDKSAEYLLAFGRMKGFWKSVLKKN